ncbi:protein SAWADEE HOMEODOMAIN HOMOLOG 1-like isoform X1 [Primulina huaijiensis]|uniref:protein SAWADEE HOMEODOMAIN HOMOLOG 1-like isoform X1 n=2 Tax=Primulina huaijiensis TaxID=1492673 RepID=UPI003CC7885E
MFEARSAKDYAWFDVAYFLNFRVLNSGELMVRVRFAGFDREEDEWVSADRAIRERSIPLVPTECDTVNAGDQVLCYRVNEYHALYVDAHIMGIERELHDESCCTCVFKVRYDYDNVEEKVGCNNLCRRPSKGSKASSFSSVVIFI